MKKHQPALLLGALGIFTSSLAFAQNYQTMPIQSGFNEDVIANGIGSALSSTTNILDGDSYVYVAKNFQANSTSTPITYGVPVDGIINSVVASTPGLSYQLGNLSQSNSLRLSNANLTGTMVFTSPIAATKLYMLSTSGSALSTLSVTVNFTDGTTQQFTGISVPDWYNGTDFAIQGLGRINRNTDGLDAAGGTNPRMYQAVMSIDAANYTKPIQGVTITKTSTTNGFPNIFAFSADAFSTCAPPVLQAATNITANGVTLNWTASTSTQANSYNVYYSTSSTPPTATTAPNLSNISGTSTSIASLQPNTTYYYWVKTNCGGTTAQSVWSFVGTVKTACGAVTSMSENFDSYNTGTTLPDCWVRNFVNGTMTISSTTPASGTRNVYQTNTSTQTPSTVVLPEFSNINAGTHWLKLKARVTTATGTLNVGYVTNPTDASTFVLIQALSITNTNYTSTNPEYTVIVPSSVPANARLAVRNTADGKGYYWDDVVWEAVPSCFPPTALTTSAITSNSATLSWTAPSSAPASGYEYTYTTTNTAPTGNGTSVSGTSAIIPLPSPSTTYYLWVRSKCNATSTSVWVNATVNTKAINDECSAPIAITPGATFTTNPVTATTVGATSTSDATATHTCQTTGYNDTWYSVVVPASGNLTIETQSATGSAVSDTVLGVYTGSCGSLTQVGCDDDSSSDGNFSLVTLTGQTPGATLLIGVWNYSSSSSGQFRIAAYDASLSTSDLSVVKKNVKVYPNPFSDIINISEFKDIKTIKVTDVAGRTLRTIENPAQEINLGSLNSGLYLITMYFKDGSQHTVKTIKK
ncbi:T9SS type A sorting domain-containing protein [Chryseobacterium aquaticum]|uniref:T9SS type A sorting domain-containing protein n=1 Tax=Chryseobacterium aquaticum TaxID=452084 RepID=A0A848NB28_9FLAO|nr:MULTISPECIES: fibronectin type III domain-containing protein [Chryseobacterium]NMR35958.1 T9SS type A sorting domain-containing protein [Chryseobacterium aquaticum]NRQ48033.1 fibronectin type III domain-containing protein [Chryseobacterium sp. C-204]